MIIRVKGAVIIGVLATTILSFLGGIAPMPMSYVSLPPSIVPIFMQLNIADALTLDKLPIVLIIFVLAYVDTVGTLIGLSARGGLLDKDGNLPEIEKPMLADAVANLVAPVLGTTTTGAFIESAAGIEEGGRRHVGVRGALTAVLHRISLSIVHWLLFRSIREKTDLLFSHRSTGCHYPPLCQWSGFAMDEHRKKKSWNVCPVPKGIAQYVLRRFICTEVVMRFTWWEGFR